MLWGTRKMQQEVVEGSCVQDRQGGCYGVHVYSNRNWLKGGVWRIGKVGVMGFTYIPTGSG